jgi:mxaJ protein
MRRNKSLRDSQSIQRFIAVGLWALFCSAPNVAAEDVVRTALKVCADPFSLPTSDESGAGYENKIAELFGRKLGLPVEYTWFPQRVGFIRNTLTNNETPDGRYKCDLVMGVIENFDLAATTRAYMRSAWAIVYVKGRGLDFIKSQDDLLNVTDEQKAALRIGVWDKGAATQYIHQIDLMEQAIPYPSMSGDPKVGPAQIIEDDLINDKINLTFVWGPIAGYYAKQTEAHEIVVIPMRNEPGLRFDFQITMAVRHSDNEWKEQVNRLIAENQGEIDKILKDYGVPMLPLIHREMEEGDDE